MIEGLLSGVEKASHLAKPLDRFQLAIAPAHRITQQNAVFFALELLYRRFAALCGFQPERVVVRPLISHSILPVNELEHVFRPRGQHGDASRRCEQLTRSRRSNRI
uniref:Uncharacterized protein n=1 Tax=Emiliania huxleyi TaxID=2903 RepID=A0A7S3RFW3_EMIHU